MLSLNQKHINKFYKEEGKKGTEGEMDMIKGVTSYSSSVIFQPHLNVKTRTKQGHHWTHKLAFCLTNAPERTLWHSEYI